MTIEEFLLNGSHSDARMYLRRKSNLAPSATAQGVVLCVHGATYGATHTFDYPVGDRSWMDHLARSGFDVWCLDLTGYGLAEIEKCVADISKPSQLSRFHCRAGWRTFSNG